MDIVQIVIQAGAVGVAIFLSYIIWKLVGNHINHNTEALKNLAVVIGELKQFLEDNHAKKEE